jgi:uncharacterized protein YgfB (UPF0149 family)
MVINGSGSITGLSAGGLPDATIQQADLAANVAGNGPAFSAYLAAAYNISSATSTKLKLDAERFDTNSNFDTSTYRFTPTVAGYYWIETTVLNNGASAPTRLINLIYKNGTQYGVFTQDQTTGYSATGGKLIYLNGSTDYIELYGYIAAAVAEVSGAEMHGYLARAA